MSRKTFYTILFIVLILAALGWLIYVYYPDYQIWRFQQSVLKLTQGIQDYLAKDTYGGQTPEETYNLYIAALQRGDTDAASKYFYWEKQVAQKQKLDDLKAKGELAKYIADLPKWGELKEEAYGNGKQYILTGYNDKPHKIKAPDGSEFMAPPGEYIKFSIIFQLNKSANIWKIYSL